MPLPKPTLDNRRFDQLVGEGRALIPRLAPRWTDHNASDPGITLLELGAWLAEQNIYRFDRLSEEAARAFVRLVGVEPNTPGVARTVVAVANRNAAGVGLPARMQLATGDGGPLFETTEPVFALPARLVRVKVGKASLVDVTADNAPGGGFDAFGGRPRPGHALYLGFDRALDAAGATLALHVWTLDWRDDGATRAALLAEYARQSTPAGRPCAEQPDWRWHYRVSTVWEFHAGGNVWLPLQDVVDETRAMTLSGFVRFTAPVNHQAGGPGAEFFVRCRIVSGRFECPPRIRHVVVNAVSAEHAVSIGERSIGTSHGHAWARYTLGAAPVVAGSVALRLDNAVGGVQTDWREAPDFDRAGPHDRVFVLDPERGELQSGNGLRAQVLPAGYQVYASFRVGGDAAGNIDAGTLTRVLNSAANLAFVPGLATLAFPMEVAQPFAACGGCAREMLATAQDRAFNVANVVDKAVTVEDIERLALAVPGVPIARVRAVANREPQLPCYPAPGVVSLIVIPSCPHPAPLPSQALLDAVERYLEPRRLITSEIRAIAPRYRRVGVNATLHIARDGDAEQVLRDAKARIDTFFDPLEGGPDRSGWPFGRTVYRSEVMTLLADTPGVVRVLVLTLQAVCCGVDADGGRCDNVELCAHELVVPGRHQLTIESEIALNLRRSDAHECESI
jgi:predicted phage baseplate assembly protein